MHCIEQCMTFHNRRKFILHQRQATQMQQEEQKQQAAEPPGEAATPQPQPTAPQRGATLTFTHPKSSFMVIASLRQQANPVLKYFSSVPFCLAPIAPDFLVGAGACVVFLSLKFHRLHPKQLLQRLLPLQRRKEYSKRFLLLLNDVEAAHASLAQVVLHAFHCGFILLVAASSAEAAELLQQLKASENRAADSLQPTLDGRHTPRCAEVLRVLPAVNRADFVSLAKEFGCMRNILQAQQQQFQQCPGIGPKKVRALLAAFQEPFFPDIDPKTSASLPSSTPPGPAKTGSTAVCEADSARREEA